MATATTRRSDPRARSLELAQASHLIGACRFVSVVQNTEGTTLAVNVTVASRSSATSHVVQYVAATDSATCDCPAGARRHACAHAGAGLEYGRMTMRLYSPAGRIEAEIAYHLDLAAEDNATALGYGGSSDPVDLYEGARHATARTREAW